MAVEPLFPPWSDAVLRAVLLGVLGLVVGLPALAMAFVRTPWVTHVGHRMEQPLAFDHRHHVRDDGIGCLYCHWQAERSRFAGIPPTEVCLGCHAQIRTESPLLAPLWDSVASGTPIRWRRVHDLPDFVAFDHASHVHGGVGCGTCHGDVAGMASVARVEPLTMQWCTDCHEQRGAATSCTTCHR
jgi:hypothetical protein